MRTIIAIVVTAALIAPACAGFNRESGWNIKGNCTPPNVCAAGQIPTATGTTDALWLLPSTCNNATTSKVLFDPALLPGASPFYCGTDQDSGGGGSGDITSVGDCTTGACFVDGTNAGTVLVYEGATVNANETRLTFTGDPSADFTVTIPNETGTICTTGSVCTGYVPTTLTLAGIGGVDFSTGETQDLNTDPVIIQLDLTEVNDVTWGDNSDASIVWTFNQSGATDPVWTVSNNSMDLTTGVLKYGGSPVVRESRTLSGGTGIATIGDLSANRTIDVVTTELGPQTWWDGSTSQFDWSFDISGSVDPKIRFSDTSVDVILGTLKQGGTAVTLQSRTLTGGTGIAAIGDLSADRTISVDTTEIGTTTFGSGGSAYAWTFDVSGTDTGLTFGSGLITGGTNTAIGLANQNALRLYETNGGGGTNYFALRGPSTQGSDYTASVEITGNCNSNTNGGKLTINGSNNLVCADDTGSTLSGPGSSTDEAVPRWNGTGGTALQDSTLTLTDNGVLANTSTVSGSLSDAVAFSATFDPSSTFSGTAAGLVGSAEAIGTNNFTSTADPGITGVYGLADDDTSGTVSFASGVYGEATDKNDKITKGAGVFGRCRITSGGTLPSCAALYAGTPVLTSGTITAPYGIYQEGTSPNYFGGTLMGGTTSSDNLTLEANTATFDPTNTGRIIAKDPIRVFDGNYTIGTGVVVGYQAGGNGDVYTLTGSPSIWETLTQIADIRYTANPTVGPIMVSWPRKIIASTTNMTIGGQLYRATPNYESDGVVLTMQENSSAGGSFHAGNTFSTVNSGTIVGSYDDFGSSAAIGAGVTLTTRTGYSVTDASTSGGGSVANQIAFDCRDLDAGTTSNTCLKSDDTAADMRFAGPARFGATGAPTVTLDVQGTASVSTKLNSNGLLELWDGGITFSSIGTAEAPFAWRDTVTLAEASGVGGIANFELTGTYNQTQSNLVAGGVVVRGVDARPTFTGDVANGTTWQGFVDWPIYAYDRAAGTTDPGNPIGFTSAFTVNTDSAITTRTSFSVVDATGTGTIANQLGFDCADLTKGGTSNTCLRSLGTAADMRFAGPARFGATGAPTSGQAVDVQGILGVSSATPQIVMTDTDSGQDDYSISLVADDMVIKNTGGTGGDWLWNDASNATMFKVTDIGDIGTIGLVELYDGGKTFSTIGSAEAALAWRDTVTLAEASGIGGMALAEFTGTYNQTQSNFAAGTVIIRAVDSRPTFTGDVANGVQWQGFVDIPVYGYDRASGTTATGNPTGFTSGLTSNADSAVGTRTGFLVNDATGTGTVTTQIGLDIAALSKATTNVGIRNASKYRATPQTQTIADNGNGGTAASGTITPSAEFIRVTCSDAQGCDITMSETGAGDGDRVEITNASGSSGNLNFADSGGVLEMSATCNIDPESTIVLRYNNDRWHEVACKTGV